MPNALMRACAGRPSCPNLVARGVCPDCSRAREQRRGSAHARGYTRHWRDRFRPRFAKLLLDAAVRGAQVYGAGQVVCGAALPGGPPMADSRCRAEGRLTFSNPDGSELHLDHDPPLAEAERAHRRVVENPLRVGFLCAADHSAKIRREQAAGLV